MSRRRREGSHHLVQMSRWTISKREGGELDVEAQEFLIGFCFQDDRVAIEFGMQEGGKRRVIQPGVANQTIERLGPGLTMWMRKCGTRFLRLGPRPSSTELG